MLVLRKFTLHDLITTAYTPAQSVVEANSGKQVSAAAVREVALGIDDDQASWQDTVPAESSTSLSSGNGLDAGAPETLHVAGP